MFNIVPKDMQDFVLCSCSTLEIAQKRLKDIKENDKKLKKYYNWDKLPQYKIIEGSK